MKRISPFLAGLVLIAASAHAQTFTGFGIITQEEKMLKECPFDQEAEAIYLLHEGFSNYNEEYNLVTDHHIRIKILKEKGIGYGNVTIPFYSDHNFERISDIEGVVINFDDQGNRSEQKLDRKSIYVRKTTEYHSEVSFAFPSVKTGSILEYKYRSTMKHYGGLDDWTFQEELPVMKSRYSLTILPNYEFSYLFKKSPSLPADVKQDPASGQVHFAMSNIPGLRNEPYMDARKDYLQRVTFQLASYQRATGYGYSASASTIDKTKYNANWEQVIKEISLEKTIGGQINKNLDHADEFIKSLKPGLSNSDKVQSVLNYVRNNMTWNGINSRHSPDGIKNAWNKKSGTNGEINLILVNLLRQADLDAYPMLVSERRNGKVEADYPSADQFNTVYAFLSADNKKFYLNANDKVTPPGVIPEDILNTKALIIDRRSKGLIDVADDILQSSEATNIMANLSDDGRLNGRVFIRSQDYARVNRLKKYHENKEKYLDQAFVKNTPDIHVDSFAIENEETDSEALEQKFAFQLPVQQTGEYLFVPLNLFTGFEENPFVAANRFSQVNFGYQQSFSFNTIIRLPQSLVVDALPKPIKLINENETIVCTRQISKDATKNEVVTRIDIQLKKSLYTVDEYYALKEFYKKMFGLLNEQIVLKKKI